MKRETADKNLKKIIENLNNRVTEPDGMILSGAWLFGSMLTDKDNPGDIDIAVAIEKRPKLDHSLGLAKGLTMLERPLIKLRKGMKNVSIHYKEELDNMGCPSRQIWP